MSRFSSKPFAAMDVTVTVITPEMAQSWLASYWSPWPWRELPRSAMQAVDLYAEEMTTGRWQLLSDGIKLTADGQLIDGRRRLLAIIQADIPVEMVVIRGYSVDDWSKVNSPQRRRHAHSPWIKE